MNLPLGEKANMGGARTIVIVESKVVGQNLRKGNLKAPGQLLLKWNEGKPKSPVDVKQMTHKDQF